MVDTAAAVITHALSCHRVNHYPSPGRQVCACGLEGMGMGDRREAHLSDVVVAALTQAGILGTQPVAGARISGYLPAPEPITTRTDYTREAHWRAAALEVVATWTHEPIRGVHVAAVQQEDLEARWPSMATAIRRLVQAKTRLLEETP